MAGYQGDKEKADALEKDIASSSGENRFRLFLRTYNNFNKIKK
jgi:hypothetical protein